MEKHKTSLIDYHKWVPLLHINVILTRALIIFKLISQWEHYPLFSFSCRNQTENWSVIKHPTQNCMISCINSPQTNSPIYTWDIFFYDPQCWHYFIRNNDLYNNWAILSGKIKCSPVWGRVIFLTPFIGAHSMCLFFCFVLSSGVSIRGERTDVTQSCLYDAALPRNEAPLTVKGCWG